MPSSLLAPPGTGTAAPIRRFHTLVRVRGDASANAASVVEHTLPPGYLSMPVHRHAATEVLHVLAGALVVWLDGAELAAPAGTSVVVPGGAAHTFWVDPDAAMSARLLAVFAPGGMERYFEEVATHVPPAGEGRPPDMPAVLDVSARHGVHVDMNSLYELIGRHGLALA